MKSTRRSISFEAFFSSFFCSALLFLPFSLVFSFLSLFSLSVFPVIFLSFPFFLFSLSLSCYFPIFSLLPSFHFFLPILSFFLAFYFSFSSHHVSRQAPSLVGLWSCAWPKNSITLLRRKGVNFPLCVEKKKRNLAS